MAWGIVLMKHHVYLCTTGKQSEDIFVQKWLQNFINIVAWYDFSALVNDSDFYFAIIAITNTYYEPCRKGIK